jgi:hypothetical protein
MRLRIGSRLIGVMAIALIAASCSGGAKIDETQPSATQTGLPLHETSYPDLGFNISVPGSWTERKHSVEGGLIAVLHFDPLSGDPAKPKRGVDVIVEKAQIADVRRGVVDIFSRRFTEYRQIRLVDDITVDGKPAFKHEFLAEGLRYDQWWVSRDGGSYRITCWGPINEFPAAGAVNDQILASFRQTGSVIESSPSPSPSPTSS